jgi:hypothetical protein
VELGQEELPVVNPTHQGVNFNRSKKRLDQLAEEALRDLREGHCTDL